MLTFGNPDNKQPVTCVAKPAATAQSRLQCLHECPSSDMALRGVAFGGKSKILPPGALMDLTQKKQIINLESLKTWMVSFFLGGRKFEEP